MKVTALLTGRGNNTLKDKNILDILGHPVMYYPAHAGRMAKTVDFHYCSSDDEKILRAAEAEGYQRIVRPDYQVPMDRRVRENDAGGHDPDGGRPRV